MDILTAIPQGSAGDKTYYPSYCAAFDCLKEWLKATAKGINNALGRESDQSLVHGQSNDRFHRGPALLKIVYRHPEKLGCLLFSLLRLIVDTLRNPVKGN
jgi:hypothetical protein